MRRSEDTECFAGWVVGGRVVDAEGNPVPTIRSWTMISCGIFTSHSRLTSREAARQASGAHLTALPLIHRSAWKGYSPKFAGTAF
jgi:hypothetical protein